tara:strand:- start:386 stop:601 length:216 start_codon:yes stop_codon:yes gene_type:complete
MNNADMPAMAHDIVFGKGYPLNYDPTGLTKREHFAGLAMQGLLAHYGTVVNETCAVQFADALLKALEQDNE